MASLTPNASSDADNAKLNIFGVNLNNEDAEYVRELTTYSMNRLSKEPWHLEQEGESLQAEIEELAVKHYSNFIQSAQCIRDSHKSINEMNQNVETLMKELPNFAESCEAFSEEATAISKEQELNRLMIENQVQLLELLELPQLMETCVRNNLYEEALDLKDYADTLSKRHPDISVLEDIIHDMLLTVETIRRELISSLRGQIQLSMCLRAVGYLRRIGLDEQRLRALFLECRAYWLESNLERLSPVNLHPYEHLSKFLDFHRVQLFEVITQYRAIFVDDSSSSEDTSSTDHGLLFHWVGKQVLKIRDTLEAFLPSICEGSYLSNLLDQCMYCGLALSRVGVDFRSLITPLFEQWVICKYSDSMKQALTSFEESLDINKWHIPRTQLAKLGVASASHQDAEVELLEYPPVAVLINACIVALNQLRQCNPLSVKAKIISLTESTMHTAILKLANMKRLSYTNLSSNKTESKNTGNSSGNAEATYFSDNNTNISTVNSNSDGVESICRVFADIAIPYLENLMKDTYESDSAILDTDPLVHKLQSLYPAENLEKDTISDKNHPSSADSEQKDDDQDKNGNGVDENRTDQQEQENNTEIKDGDSDPDGTENEKEDSNTPLISGASASDSLSAIDILGDPTSEG